MRKLPFNLCIAFLAGILMNFVTPAFSSPTPTPTATTTPTPTVTVTTTPTPQPPTVTTGEAEAGFSCENGCLVTFNGTVNPNGLLTTTWFEYGETSGVYSNITATQNINGTTDTTVAIDIEGYGSYYYRIAAHNSAGTSYGNEMYITMLPDECSSFWYTLSISAQTGTATNITSNSATLNGSYDIYGSLTGVWFEYGTPEESYSTSSIESSDSNVSADVNGLKPDTTYYYRIIAEGGSYFSCDYYPGGNTGYGNFETFTTLPTANSITVYPINIILTRKKSVEITITVRGENSSLVDGETVATKINNAGKKCISILPKSTSTDENGEAKFTITAKNKTGNARVTFKAGSLKKSIVVKVRR